MAEWTVEKEERAERARRRLGAALALGCLALILTSPRNRPGQIIGDLIDALDERYERRRRAD